MKNHAYLRFSGLLCLVLLFVLSCAGGGSNPITPGGNSPTPASENDGTLTPPTAQNSGGALNESGPSIWGLYNIIYDNTTCGFEIEPLRGAQLTLNVLGFLQPPIGSPANLGLKITDPSKFGSEGILKLNISITHPFKLARLVGFDTMGVLIGNGGANFQQDSSAIVAGANELHLLNADGYTRWMNPVEFTESGVGGFIEGAMGAKGQTWTSTVNSYKYFADGIGAQENVGDYLSNADNILNRGAFFPETTLTREYEIKFPYTTKPQVKFQYAILTHFQAALDTEGDPIKEPVIDDFDAGANAQEAVFISADTSGSTLYYDPEHLNGGGTLEIVLTVYDWQGMESLGGTGAFGQIDSIGLGSWDNLFGATGILLNSASLDGTEQSSGTNSTTLKLTLNGLAPGKVGLHDIFIAVYSADPTSYGPNLGKPFPGQAKLAAYARMTVNVIEKIIIPPNNPPVVDEIQGPTEVDCWSGPTVYTCIAHDSDVGDTIQYEAQYVELGELPFFKFIFIDDPTITIDWSDEDKNPPGIYMVFFQITDGKDVSIGPPVLITKSENAIKLNFIAADPDDIFNVFCSNIDAVYTCDYDTCGQPPVVSFRWLRGTGTPPPKPSPDDPGWTELSESPEIVMSWDGTEIGEWWLICSAFGDFGTLLTPYLMIERVDSPPTNVNPPEGAIEVDCNMTSEEYALTGGDDCDGGTITREWTLTVTDQEPTEGWLLAYNDVFHVNWSLYEIGTYFLWQRVGTGSNYTIADPLEVHRVNTGPDTPNPPSGLSMVSCTDTSALYQAGVVGDCEDDPLTRQWALGTDINPPTTGWTDFSGTTFHVDYSGVPNGFYGLFQRASDDGADWSYSTGLMINKKNAAPDKPDTPDGPSNVTCHDSDAEYLAGTASDCDSGDTLTRYWGISADSEFPPMDWFEFTGDSFTIDWSQYMSSLWYVFQMTVDSSAQQSASTSLAVLKSNSAPEVGPPTGPTEVSCTDTDAEYFETTVEDCDLATTLIKSRYLSTSPGTPSGGSWQFYSGESFAIDFSKTGSGDFYLFLKASDSQAETLSDPLHIYKSNTPPEKPQVPSGLTEIDCGDLPVLYDGGSMSDCDTLDELARYYYLSTDSLTPIGGTWILTDSNPFIVDLTGITAEEYYYLFQKITDGMDETLSDSLEIIYHNSAPSAPFQPTGDTTVSCVNDHESYLGKTVVDCDSWQTLTREWAIATSDWPPAVGWTAFTGENFFVDWSLYDEGTYYLFQRVYDGFEHAYSESLQVEIGPPSLIQPPIPDGPEDLICDDPVTAYDAGSYLAGCPGLSIVREWAYNNVPTPPLAGWTVFTGTTFDVDPADLGVGNWYLFQRATLDLQKQNSSPLWVEIHPGDLGDPDVPSGATSVDCNSTAEDYEMGDVTVACAGTPVTRSWQVQTTSGTPLGSWNEFVASPVTVDWTFFTIYDQYHLVQKADDGDHVTYSDPLTVTFVNDEPSFAGGISGDTAVTCIDKVTLYDCGDIDDCDDSQTITREWAWNTVDAFPISGWTQFFGTTFTVDYSSSSIQPGDVYLFQRVSDGLVTVYDFNSLYVVYTNTAPVTPDIPDGSSTVDCTTLQQDYDAGEAFDCDGTEVTREWAMNTVDSPPVAGWAEFTGDLFSVDWTGAAPGTFYLFQRVSDGDLTSTSLSLPVTVVNTAPSITSFVCTQGAGPHNSDGETTGLTGLSFVNELDFTFDVTDCDGNDLDKYWIVKTSLVPPDQADPDWQGPLSSNAFTLDTADYLSLAPSRLYVFIGVSDGYTFSRRIWGGQLYLWKKVWVTDFAGPSEAWTENGCYAGSGSYAWSYLGVNGGVQSLINYFAGSTSAVWSDTVTFPAAPAGQVTGWMMSWVNPALDPGLDNVRFSFLDEVHCTHNELAPMTGEGCVIYNPQIKEFEVSSGSSVWGNDRRIGMIQNGLDGCINADFWVDWVGVWLKPTS